MEQRVGCLGEVTIRDVSQIELSGEEEMGGGRNSCDVQAASMLQSGAFRPLFLHWLWKRMRNQCRGLLKCYHICSM